MSKFVSYGSRSHVKRGHVIPGFSKIRNLYWDIKRLKLLMFDPRNFLPHLPPFLSPPATLNSSISTGVKQRRWFAWEQRWFAKLTTHYKDEGQGSLDCVILMRRLLTMNSGTRCYRHNSSNSEAIERSVTVDELSSFFVLNLYFWLHRSLSFFISLVLPFKCQKVSDGVTYSRQPRFLPALLYPNACSLCCF